MTIAYDLTLSGFPSGVKMIFGEQTAPLGWQKTTVWADNIMLCINTEVDGTSLEGSGDIDPQANLSHPGNPFTIIEETGHTHTHTLVIDPESSHTHNNGTLNIPNHSHSTSGHQLTTNELPSHRHTYIEHPTFRGAVGIATPFSYNYVGAWTGYTGGASTPDIGNSHTHGNTVVDASDNSVSGDTGSPTATHNHDINDTANVVTGGLSHTHTLSGTLSNHGTLRYQETILCIKD